MESRGTSYIAFIELFLDTNWTEVPLAEWGKYLDTKQMGRFVGPGWSLFRAEHSAEIELLEPEVIRRRMQFKPKTILAVGNQIIRYQDSDYEHELVVNEPEQLGRKK